MLMTVFKKKGYNIMLTLLLLMGVITIIFIFLFFVLKNWAQQSAIEDIEDENDDFI